MYSAKSLEGCLNYSPEFKCEETIMKIRHNLEMLSSGPEDVKVDFTQKITLHLNPEFSQAAQIGIATWLWAQTLQNATAHMFSYALATVVLSRNITSDGASGLLWSCASTKERQSPALRTQPVLRRPPGTRNPNR